MGEVEDTTPESDYKDLRKLVRENWLASEANCRYWRKRLDRRLLARLFFNTTIPFISSAAVVTWFGDNEAYWVPWLVLGSVVLHFLQSGLKINESVARFQTIYEKWMGLEREWLRFFTKLDNRQIDTASGWEEWNRLFKELQQVEMHETEYVESDRLKERSRTDTMRAHKIPSDRAEPSWWRKLFSRQA